MKKKILVVAGLLAMSGALTAQFSFIPANMPES